MDLPALRYFRAVAREQSITGAARSLGVSQPTLSVAIRNLEEELGSRLFTRTRDGVALTPAGEALVGHADEILAAVEDAVQAVKDLRDDEIGAFTLGCHPSLGAYALPAWMERFVNTAPGIALSLWSGSSAEVRTAVIERRIHFGIVVNCETHDDLVIAPMFEDTIEVFGLPPRGHEARITGHSAGVEGARRRLSRSLLFWVDRPVFRGVLDEIVALDAAPMRTVACGDLEMVKAFALEGAGLGLLPGRVARYGHPGRLRPVSPALPRHEDRISLIYRGDLPRTKAARRVREALLERGRELAEE